MIDFRKLKPDHTSFCVLLQSLCVVDVDCVAVAHELERRYPILRDTIREKTSKGMHYFFSRSSLADEEGYYDCRRPVMAGIDFKTRTSTGTGGVIVVAPSPGKAWVVDPWRRAPQFAAPEIPDDLLNAVARPSHPLCRIVFKCQGNELVDVRVRHMAASPYVAMFQSAEAQFRDTVGTEDGQQVVPVHSFSKSAVEAACQAVSAGRSLTASCNAAATISDALAFMDFLCISKTRIQRVAQETDEMLALQAVDAKAHDAAMRSDTVLVDDRLASALKHAHVHLGSDEVLMAPEASLQAKFATTRRYAPTRALVEQPVQALHEMMPACVLGWLQKFPGKLAVAGGFVTGAVCPGIEQGSDIDIFMIVRSPAEGDAIANDILTDAAVSESEFTGCALTIGLKYSLLAVQLIPFLIPSADEIVRGFDLDPCRALAIVDSETRELQIRATHSWVRAVQTRTFRIDPTTWTSTSVMRVSKYCKKGLRAYIPNLDRDAVRQQVAASVGQSAAQCVESLRRCLVTEPPTMHGSLVLETFRLRHISLSKARRKVGSVMSESQGALALFAGEWLCLVAATKCTVDTGLPHRALCSAARRWHVSDYGSLADAEGVVRHIVLSASRFIQWLRRAGRGLPPRPHAGPATSSSDTVRIQVPHRDASAPKPEYLSVECKRLLWRSFAPGTRLRALHPQACDFRPWRVNASGDEESGGGYEVVM